jgi:hypothetical protein
MTTIRGSGLVITGALLLAGAPAWAQQVSTETWVEAEVSRDFGNVQPPLEPHDDGTASGGAYLEVAPGIESKSTPPVEGIARYTVFVPTGNYRLWARVKAPNDASDSFWVRVDGGSWIKWNEIPLGSSWHWAAVKPEGASQPSQFQLTSGVSDEHIVEVAYREAGTRLDALILSSNTAFNPSSPPAGVPATPPRPSVHGGKAAARVGIPAVPGATSYRIMRSSVRLTNVVTSQKFIDTAVPATGDDFSCYKVIAVNSFGESNPSDSECDRTNMVLRDWFSEFVPVTAPMSTVGGLHGQPGLSSKTAVPATGRGVMYIQLPAASRVKVWASVNAPDKESDSFWVRFDSGTWIRWNDISPDPACSNNWAQVTDDLNNNAPVVFSLAAGLHTLQFAYREDGASIQQVVIQDEFAEQPICSD